MKKTSIVLALIAGVISSPVQLPAFELDESMFISNEKINSYLREPMRATSYSYATVEDALACDRNKAFMESLNGEWKFRFFDDNANVPEGFELTRTESGEWNGRIQVPGCIERNGFGYPIYHNTPYPFPNTPPVISRNIPVGYYMRTFTVPEAWEGRKVILHFGGVYSGYFVWVNDTLAGYAEDSALPSEFDITPYLNGGENKLVVKVFKWTDGSYVEDADHWRASGIYREVMLLGMPQTPIYNFGVRTVFTDGYDSAELQVRPEIAAPFGSLDDGWQIKAQLFDADGKKAGREMSRAAKHALREHYPQRGPVPFPVFSQKIDNPHLWSAEDPYLYTLVMSLQDKDGATVDVRSCKVGFRDVKIYDEQVWVNGKSIKLNGTNRHDHSQEGLKAVSREEMKRDVELMKQFNFNAVRTSHYPNDPYFLELCDQYGLFVIDEANIETHHAGGYLTRQPEWAPAYIERVSRMAIRDRNHPSVIFWSLGNESGMGPAHSACSGFLKEYDPTRPIHYEGAQGKEDDPEWVDMLSRMYPELEELEDLATRPTIHRPVVMCEYAHAMGNSPGNMKEYWELVRKHKRLVGGFIWDWIDQGLLETTADGKANWCYGGDYEGPLDYGEANFLINGLLYPDRTPKASIYEIKYLCQPFSFSIGTGWPYDVSVENRQFFVDSSNYDFLWEITDGTKTYASGRLDIDTIPAGECRTATVSAKKPRYEDGREIFLNVRAVLNKDMIYASCGHEAAHYQRKVAGEATGIPPAIKGNVAITETDGEYVISAGNRELSVGKTSGWIEKYTKAGVPVLTSALVPDFTRAWTDNDKAWKAPETTAFWSTAVENLKLISIKAGKTDEGAAKIDVTKEIEGKLKLTLGYVIYKTGRVDVTFDLKKLDTGLPELIRVGMLCNVNKRFDKVSYLGCGPLDNYPDCMEFALIDEYKLNPRNSYINHVVPQETGNRMGVRYATFLDSAKSGIKIAGAEPFAFSVLPFSQQALDAASHIAEIEYLDGCNQVHIDAAIAGIGGINSWNIKARPLDNYRLLENTYNYSFSIIPVK